MTMHNHYARNLSESLFKSIYDEMYKIADSAQKSAGKNSVTEEQKTFSDFCHNKLSLADALEYLNIKKAYEARP